MTSGRECEINGYNKVPRVPVEEAVSRSLGILLTNELADNHFADKHFADKTFR